MVYTHDVESSSLPPPTIFPLQNEGVISKPLNSQNDLSKKFVIILWLKL